MGISSINIAMAGSYGAYNQKLTEATRKQLEALGMPIDRNMTESEGRKILRQLEAKKEFNNNDNNASDMFKKARDLAQKLGIPIDEKISFEELIQKIEATLELKIENNKTNKTLLEELKGYSQELATLQAQSKGASGYDNTNQALMKSLELLGQYNKNFIKN